LGGSKQFFFVQCAERKSRHGGDFNQRYIFSSTLSVGLFSSDSGRLTALLTQLFFYFWEKISMPKYHPLKVVELDHLTDRAVVITFGVPEALQSDFVYDAGQYITLEASLEGETVRRPYSICSAPNENRLQVGVKQIPNGQFSTYAKKALNVGDVLNVASPEGRFVYRPSGVPEVITAFAAGSGITPIMAIAKTVLSAHPDNQFTLIYSNKSVEDTLFYEEINTLEKTYAQRFKVIRIYSQAQVPNSLFGRIDASVVRQYKQDATAIAQQYFLCGPEPMIHAVTEALEQEGVPKDAIKYELFSASTTTQEETSFGSENAGKSVELICDEVHHRLENIHDKIILDAALQEKIDVPYSCQGGVCSSCIARVKEGEAAMDTNQILTDSEVAEGLILTCQARALTPRLVVDFDDV
jgi:ring-1,2-phenylacetyl-CoA epoxidase subunit PaaE